MAVGTATIDFGAQPGTQRAVVTVTGQATIASGSHVEAFLMGDTTADHNAEEHSMVPLQLTCGNIVAATSFDIVGVCDWLLHGQFAIHWVWI